MSETEQTLPVSTCDFWRTRINRTLAQNRDIHAAIFDTDDENWKLQQSQTKALLPKFIRPGQSVLDTGCGYGAVYECVPPGVLYTGVDISPDLIQMACFRHPEATFSVEDLRRLPYEDKQFDIAVCRSMREMILKNYGEMEWGLIYSEIQRVSRRMLLMEYGDPMPCQLVEY